VRGRPGNWPSYRDGGKWLLNLNAQEKGFDIVKLTDHDLKQINESSLSNLTHEQLIGLALKLLLDLKEIRRQVKGKSHKANTKPNQNSDKLPARHNDRYFHDDEECRNYLEYLQSKFKEYLSRNLSSRTVNKQVAIVGLLIDFLCFDCDLKKIDDITVGMANSYFRKWHLSKVGDATESELRTAVKKFFLFLDGEMGIKNEKVLNSFKRK
jgi:hypothetical protein